MSITLQQIEALLPLAANWVGQLEAEVLQRAEPLNQEELGFAKRIGISFPENIRLLKVDVMPQPTDPILLAAAKAVGLAGPNTLGRTCRYGILVRSDYWRDLQLVIHEMVHILQYERFGGIAPFLKQYVSECATVGYSNSPLELEAKAIEKRLTGRNL